MGEGELFFLSHVSLVDLMCWCVQRRRSKVRRGGKGRGVDGCKFVGW